VNTAPSKANLVVELVDVLRSRLGSDAFQIIDHWPDDPMAIGIASPQNAGVLAYIAVTPEADAPYFVSLELPPEGKWADHPYTPGDERHECGIDDLVATIAAHMRRAPPNKSLRSSPSSPE
jgi:hypothetical protein